MTDSAFTLTPVMRPASYACISATRTGRSGRWPTSNCRGSRKFTCAGTACIRRLAMTSVSMCGSGTGQASERLHGLAPELEMPQIGETAGNRNSGHHGGAHQMRACAAPWRPSKLRLVLEAQRSPGLRTSSFIAMRVRCLRISTGLDKYVEHDAVLIHRTPEIMQFTLDPNEPNLLHQRRTLSYDTATPRSARSNSTLRKIRLNT